jgi:hypothetical protein
MSEIAQLGREGDTKVIWDPNNAAEVDNARNTYNNLKTKGFAAFSVKKNGEKGSQITEFDSEAEKIIMVPPMRGG